MTPAEAYRLGRLEAWDHVIRMLQIEASRPDASIPRFTADLAATRDAYAAWPTTSLNLALEPHNVPR
jgi:hypothetical protein